MRHDFMVKAIASTKTTHQVNTGGKRDIGHEEKSKTTVKCGKTNLPHGACRANPGATHAQNEFVATIAPSPVAG